MRIIEGMENSVLIVFLIIMSFILYIFWNMLKYIMEKQNIRGQDPYEINRNANSQSDPYANSGLHEECSICTERVQYKVELDCSHSFCGKCIMEYYDSIHSNGLKCPLCRNEVRLINNEKIIRDDNTKDFYDKIVIFNHRHINGMNFYSGYIFDFGYLFYRGIRSIFNDGLLLFYFLIGLGVVIYYVLSPYDLIPDTLGLIGYLDDVSIVGVLAFWVIERFYRRFRERVESEFHQIESQ